MSPNATLGDPMPRPGGSAAPDAEPVAAVAARDAAREAEIEALRDALAQSEDARRRQLARLAGGMAHDFNNLLTIVVGYAMLLQEDEGLSPVARERLGEILRASESGTELTKRLLILGRRQTRELHTIALDHFLRTEALPVLGPLAGARVELRLQCAAPDACVDADPGELLLLLRNLVINAAEAMPAGGTVTVATALADSAPHAVPASSHLRLSVADTGHGMDDAVRARLFEPFFSTKRVGTGAGLGLAIVQTLVERHAGSVAVDTTPGRGTTVTIWLPVTRGARQPEAAVDVVAGTRGQTATVLVVEDEAPIRELTRAVLARHGYQVTTAPDPHTALRLVQEGHRFDLVVSDIVMPGMDGREMVRALEQIAPGFRVLYVSGCAGDASTAAAVPMDAAQFLAKPYTPSQLTRKVRHLLDTAR